MRIKLIQAAALAAPLMLAACGGAKKAAEPAFVIDEESGEMSGAITTEEGTAKFRSGENVPASLPMGFSVYPGAQITDNTTFEQKDKTIAMISIASDAAPAELVEHYRKEAKAAGIAIKIEMSVNDGQMIGGDDGKGNTFSFDSQKASAGLADPDQEEMDEEDKEMQTYQGDQSEQGDEEGAAQQTTATLTLSGDFTK